MKILITGGCGFLGSNLACHALKRGDELVIFDNLSREGSLSNLEWLRELGSFEFMHGDIRNYHDVLNVISECQPDVIFHLAGQVAMTTSISHPYRDFEINVRGSLNVLEAVRLHSAKTVIVYSSTNKVYGDLEQFAYVEKPSRYECVDKPFGFDESAQLDFHSPYGCSKGSADQYMLDYARIFGIKTVVLRHSSMYGGRQYATYDQGWIGWFCKKGLEAKAEKHQEPFTISGNGKQVRDALHADDVIDLYFKVPANADRCMGQPFNIGGGIENSMSLLELFLKIEMILDVKLNYVSLPPRVSDQRIFIADIKKARSFFNWAPKVSVDDGLNMMIDWVRKEQMS